MTGKIISVAEHDAGKAAALDALRHYKGRKILSMDELARMKEVRPRIEKEYSLPHNSRSDKVFMFSIDGVLDGEIIKGCLFAGECILVQERNFERAFKVAREGLQETIAIAVQLFEEQQRMVVTASPMETIAVNASGRKSSASLPGQELATDPRLKAMIMDQMRKKP